MLTLSRLHCLLFVLIILAGCSETIPTTTKSTDLQPVVKTDFLPFEIRRPDPSNTYTSEIQVLDAQNPESNITQVVASTGTAIKVLKARFNKGDIDSTASTKSNYRLDTLLYTKNNSIYKLGIHDVKTVEPIQLSNEFLASWICHEWDIWEEDLTNFNNSRYIYYLPGENCQGFDGEWHMVILAMSELDSPVNIQVKINYFISSILDSDTGALAGWLVVTQDKSLVKYDVEFSQSNSVQLNNISLSAINHSNHLITNRQNQLLLAVDEKMVWYNPGNNSIEQSLEVFPVGQSSKVYQWRSDGIHLYFTVDHFSSDGVTVLTSTLHRVLLENAIEIETLSEQSEQIDNLEVGTDGVAFSSGGVLTRYSLTATPSIAVVSTPENYTLSLNSKGLPVFFMSGSMLIAEYAKIGNLTSRLIKVLDSKKSINETHQNSYVVGVIYEKTWQTDSSRGVEKIILEGLEAGRVISTLVAADYPGLLRLGTLPADSAPRPLERFDARGHDKLLMQGEFNSVVELFFIDAGEKDSLVQIIDDDTIKRVVDF